MSFDRKVKEKAYISSARRCCVCKKFKGRNIEVHHIIQKADGGEDTFENAIPLCFECHSEAGHYNYRHPKGARYSSTELRAHRDAWYKVVEDGKIHIETIQSTHHFYLTNSFDIVSEIIKGDFSNFPLDHIKLVKNDLYHFLKSGMAFQGILDRESNIPARNYKSLEDYKSTHQDASQVESKWGFSHWERSVTREELQQHIGPKDFITNYMLRYGVDPSEIAKVNFIEGGCCESFYEEYILRGARVVFLALTNTSDENYICESIIESISDNNDFREVGEVVNNGKKVDLNDIPLAPGECLLIPVCIVLTPFEIDSYQPENPFILESIKSGQTQDARRIHIDDLGKYPTIGPYHNISSLNIRTKNSNYCLEFRPLLMNNLFLISRYWECGSCPHLLIKNKNEDKWIYKEELFSYSPDQTKTFVIDKRREEFANVTSIKIIELEDEITYIDHILLDGNLTLKDIILHTNDEVEVDVSKINLIEIQGRYTLIPNITYKNSQQIKYQKVFHMLCDVNRTHLTSQSS